LVDDDESNESQFNKSTFLILRGSLGMSRNSLQLPITRDSNLSNLLMLSGRVTTLLLLMTKLSNVWDQQIVKIKSIAERILKLERCRYFKFGKILENPYLNLHCDPLSISKSFRNMTSPSIMRLSICCNLYMLLRRCTTPKLFPNCNHSSPVRFSNDGGNSPIAVSVIFKLTKLFISHEILGNFLRLEHPSSLKLLRDFIMRQLGRI
jgi:hypothetical protein